jgi:hypothetical protein
MFRQLQNIKLNKLNTNAVSSFGDWTEAFDPAGSLEPGTGQTDGRWEKRVEIDVLSREMGEMSNPRKSDQ